MLCNEFFAGLKDSCVWLLQYFLQKYSVQHSYDDIVHHLQKDLNEQASVSEFSHPVFLRLHVGLCTLFRPSRIGSKGLWSFIIFPYLKQSCWIIKQLLSFQLNLVSKNDFEELVLLAVAVLCTVYDMTL